MNMTFADITTIVPINACETVSGEYVDVVNPDPNTINPLDIGWSLSRQARFAGHTMSEEIWNVAQHVLFVEDLVSLALDEEGNGYQLHASLEKWMTARGFAKEHAQKQYAPVTVSLGCVHHDDTEAYLIDLPSPVKRHEALREPYKALEANLNEAVIVGLGLPRLTPYEHELVVWGDLMALQIEAANLMPSRGRGWSGTLPTMTMLDVHLFPMQVKPWRLAFEDYITTHARLMEELERTNGLLNKLRKAPE
jgi:hypothetical protein